MDFSVHFSPPAFPAPQPLLLVYISYINYYEINIFYLSKILVYHILMREYQSSAACSLRTKTLEADFSNNSFTIYKLCDIRQVIDRHPFLAL